MLPRLLSRVVPAIALAVLTSVTNVFADAGAPYTVLAIHWGPEDYPASAVINAAVRQALASDTSVPIDYFAEYLDSLSFDAGNASEALAEYIRHKYRSRRIDVVIAVADPVLGFVLDHRDELFPNVPIVYSGVAVPESAGRSPDHLTGVMRGNAYIETLELALAVHPATEQVFIIANGMSRENDVTARSTLDRFSQEVRLRYLEQPSVAGVTAAVKALPPNSLVLYIWHSQNNSGSLIYADQVAPLVAEASSVPVYGTNERYIGSGVVGGVVRSVHQTGFRMGEMARQIIGGTRAEDIPIENARLVPIVDWRQVLRWRINPSRLPDGSDIRFKVSGVWESYGSSVVVIFLVIAAQLVLIAGLVRQRTRRHGAEDALRAKEATLRTSYDRIRQLAGRLMTAQEATRASIARGLHDDVCQDLVALSLAICRLKDLSKRVQNARVQQELSRLQQWTMALADSVRRLSHDLHPATLGLLGLASAIKGHCLEVRKGQGVDVRFIADGDLGHIDREVAVCLFRMAQEALRNGLVHGNARHLVVSLARTRGDVELTVVDDGAGFDPEAVRRNGSGLGLVSMEERAYALGGELQITSSPGLGTTVYVCVPAASATAQEPATTSACVGTLEPDVELTAIEDA